MGRSAPLSVKLKEQIARSFIEQASEQDWDYNTFVTKAATKGLTQDPNIINYSKILAEKKSLSRGKEVAGVVKGAMGSVQDTPPQMQPIQSAPTDPSAKATMPIAGRPETPEEQQKPLGQLPAGRMPELNMQPTAIETPGTYRDPTREEAHERAQRSAVDQGMQPPTLKEEEEYGMGMLPTGFSLEEQRRKQEQIERRTEKDKLGAARLKYKKEFDDAMMRFRYYKESGDIREGEQNYQLAKDRLTEVYTDAKGAAQRRIAELKLEAKQLEKGTFNKQLQKLESDNVDWERIQLINQEIAASEVWLSDLEMEKKMIGAVPGERKTFDGKGNETTNRPAPVGMSAAPSTIPEPATPEPGTDSPAPDPTKRNDYVTSLDGEIPEIESPEIKVPDYKPPPLNIPQKKKSSEFELMKKKVEIFKRNKLSNEQIKKFLGNRHKLTPEQIKELLAS